MPGELQTRTNIPRQLWPMVEELWETVNEIINFLNEVKTDFEAHTHNADGSESGSYYTSTPRTDAATVDLGTARTISTALPTKPSH